ncbi:hypothetical protein B566_EDAN009582 [Ephemera danica]|nr:hypothetical protein B566_EDAN009582 [Ephemera danica]
MSKVNISNGTVKMPDNMRLEDWKTLVQHYAGTLSLAGVALLFAVLMPCAGFIFCCCRCVGRCGARSHAYDKRHDPCKRVSLGIVLSAFAIIMLFGVVCAFVTNQYLEEGVEELPDNVRAGLSDTELYLANTKEEVNNLLVTNYRELQVVLNDILEGSGQIVKDKLAEVSKAVALNNLTAIVSGLGRIKEDLADINQLPNVSSSLKNVSRLIDNNIEREVLQGKKSFDDIQIRIQSSVNQTIPRIKSAIRKAGHACEKTAKDIIRVLDKVNQRIPEHVLPKVRQGEHLLNQYSIYRYYLDTTTSTLLLVILACLTLGLFYGFCGKRPDGLYGGDDYCCNKGTGGRYLMAGVYLMFLFSIGLAGVAVAHLLVGVMAEKAVCESLESPTPDSQLMNMADEYFKLSQLYPQGGAADIPLSKLIRSCHQNQSMYEVLGLEAVINVSQVSKFRNDIVDQLNETELEQQIRLKSDVVMLTDGARQHLLNLANSPLSDIDFTAYNDLVENQITSIDLKKLAKVVYYLQNEAMFLESSQIQIVDVMTHLSRQLRANTTALQEDLKFNHSSLREAVHGLIREVESAQNYLSQNGPDDVVELARLFVEEFTRHIDDYLARVVRLTKTSIGKCWPISRVYNATVVSNGFWMSIGWSLAIFIPAIFVCVTLASLYNKADTYHGPLVDSEYLYDAYADRDNIPLANVHDKKNRGGQRQSYDNQSGYVGDYSGGGGSGAGGGGGSGAHQALVSGRGNSRRPVSSDGARFRDAAPKHWDFPSGGPPGYRNPPPATEYERPPPYYYPGPGSEVMGTGRSSTSSSSSGTNGGAPAVFTYQKLEALESRLYHGGASLVPASTWRRQTRLTPRPALRP